MPLRKQAYWKVRIGTGVEAGAKRQGLTDQEIVAGKDAFRRLALEENPTALQEVLAVESTNREWYRLKDERKIPGLRLIFVVIPYNPQAAKNSGLLGVLVLKAILRRDDQTYHIVHDLWLADEG
jgi:hypothetical protein